MKTNIALVKGSNRYRNISKALNLIRNDIRLSIKDKKKILIKPNFVSVERQLAATHVDAVKALLDFLQELGIEKFLIAEGPAYGKADEGFKNFNYYQELGDYDIEFRDLDDDEYNKVKLFDENLKPLDFRVSKTVIESDYRISVTPLKTHDTVIATLSLKNMLVGALIGNDKNKLHQGYNAINLSLCKLAEIIPPNLSVLDGFLAMEGNGPIEGDSVKLEIAIAGIDFLAVDSIASMIMGFDPEEIGYLNCCRKKGLGIGDISKIHILGEDIESCKRKFKPHSTYEEQLNWD